MNKVVLLSSLLLLSFCVACGGNNSSGGGPTPQGNFSNASLSGQYTYQVSGTDLGANAPFREAGVFTADGNGHITTGGDDFTEGTSGVANSSFTGTYSIGNDGTGTLVFNFSSGSITFGVTLISSSRVKMIEADSFANASGNAELQNASAFATPTGTFAFRSHSVTAAQGSTGIVGVVTVSGGVVTGGFEDVNSAGVLTAPVLTSGLLNAPDGNGRGTGTFVDNTPHTSTFVYYVVDGNNFRILSSDAGILALGRAEKQTGPFTDASLSGNFAFGTSGDTNNSLGGIHTAGRFTSDGAGNLSTGTLDFAEDGTASLNGLFSAGSFTPVDATGRTVATFNASNRTMVVILQMVNSSRGFVLGTDATSVEDGTIDKQTVSSFSNSTMNGQFSFVTSGFDSLSLLDRVGTLQWDGAGHLFLSELLNRDGVVTTSGTLDGTYSVASTGRVSGSVNSLSSNLVFYLISGSDGYILQGDTGAEVSGSMSLQH